MLYFFLGLALLVLGYYTYGRYIEKILAPDDRKTSNCSTSRESGPSSA